MSANHRVSIFVLFACPGQRWIQKLFSCVASLQSCEPTAHTPICILKGPILCRLTVDPETLILALPLTWARGRCCWHNVSVNNWKINFQAIGISVSSAGTKVTATKRRRGDGDIHNCGFESDNSQRETDLTAPLKPLYDQLGSWISVGTSLTRVLTEVIRENKVPLLSTDARVSWTF